ncbi:MAG: murein biosynthesis integral membrane protein MurJ [Rhodospirillaceae bacterium]|nr:murein biosynthesis integral membrane protein MurJ [Rhodospirillaceae bacterium]
MNLLSSILTVGGLTMVSRVLGFVRDILIAAIVGATGVGDAFFVAFKLPNLFRRLFAEGAFASAFVPIFAGKLEADGEAPARKFAEESLAVLFVLLALVTALAEIAMPWLMRGLAPGFLDEPEKFDLTVWLTRITFPYLLFISLVSLLAGVLNSVGKFAAAAATPVLLNLSLIGFLLAAAPVLPSPAHALAWGVFAAGAVQLVWLYWAAARAGFALRLNWPKLTGDVRLLFRRIVPVAVGAGVYQINLVIDMIIASLLPSGSISYLFFADRVTQLPLGVIGVAVGTALLPMLSRQLRAGEDAAAMHSQNRALEFSLLLTIPAAVALAIIAGPIVAALFQRGAFTAEQAGATAAALAVYAWGLPAYVLVKALAPGFFARGDTKTPVIISVVAMAVNVGLSLALIGPFLHVGIAAATAISSWLNACALGWVLWRRGHFEPDARLKARLARTIAAAAVMGAGLYWGSGALAGLAAGPELDRILALAVLVGGGLAVFGLAAMVSGAARPADLRSFLKRPDPQA